MSFISGRDVRKLISLYSDSKMGFYEFDPDHAILAFPLKSLRLALNQCKLNNVIMFDEDQLRFLAKNCKDRKGPFHNLVSLFRFMETDSHG